MKSQIEANGRFSMKSFKNCKQKILSCFQLFFSRKCKNHNRSFSILQPKIKTAIKQPYFVTFGPFYDFFRKKIFFFNFSSFCTGFFHRKNPYWKMEKSRALWLAETAPTLDSDWLITVEADLCVCCRSRWLFPEIFRFLCSRETEKGEKTAKNQRK